MLLRYHRIQRRLGEHNELHRTLLPPYKYAILPVVMEEKSATAVS